MFRIKSEPIKTIVVEINGVKHMIQRRGRLVYSGSGIGSKIPIEPEIIMEINYPDTFDEWKNVGKTIYSVIDKSDVDIKALRKIGKKMKELKISDKSKIRFDKPVYIVDLTGLMEEFDTEVYLIIPVSKTATTMRIYEDGRKIGEDIIPPNKAVILLNYYNY